LFEILATDEASEQLKRLQANKGLAKRYKAVKKTLLFLSQNPRHPGLSTHEFTTLKGPRGEKVFEAMLSNQLQPLTEFFGITGQRKIRSPLLLSHPIRENGKTPWNQSM